MGTHTKRSKGPVRISVSDPRLWIGIAFGVAGGVLFLTAAGSDQADFRAAYVASAVALLGVGIPQLAAAATERRQALRRDLDETRRLCLTALGRESENALLIASLVNVTAFHSRIVTSTEAVSLFDELLRGPGTDRLKEIVNKVSTQLGEAPLYTDP